MKFKLFSVVLLLACFVFLGVLTGVIPVSEPDTAAAALFSPAPAASSAGAERSSTPEPVLPTARTAGTAAPKPSASPAATDEAVSPSPAARSTASPAGPAVPVPSGRAAGAESSLSVSPTPTASSVPSPSAEPETPSASERTTETEPAVPSEAAAAPVRQVWEPEAEVLTTTITWNDPIQNDTDFSVDGTALLHEPPAISLPAQGPQILIIHTHGTEAFTPHGEDQYEATSDYRTTDTDHSVIRVGQALGAALESYGLNVLVDTELYDWPSYNGSYGRSEAAIRQYLEEDPDIAMVIDLHRDALGNDELMYRPVSDEVDEDAAQIMLVVGTNANLEHPNWRENLALAMSLQGLAEDMYPHLMRPTLVCPYRYNQQLTPGSLTLEIGAAGNTLEEAITAAELFAQAVGPALAERVAPGA